MYKFNVEEMKNASRSTMRLARHDEDFLVSLNGSPVAMYHQDIVRKAVRADENKTNFKV